MRPLARSLLTLPLLAAAASAADLHVPGGYPTIQAAVDAAVSGDKVLVASGVHAGPVKLKAGIKLIGSGWKTCVIDAQEKGSVLRIHGDATAKVVVRGFTLRNSKHDSYPQYDCGFYVTGAGGPMNLRIEDNRFEACGWGFLPGSFPYENKNGLIELRRNQFVGLAHIGIRVPNDVSMEIRNNTVTGCSLAISSHPNAHASLIVENNVIAFNKSIGISVTAAQSHQVRYNVFYKNAGGSFYEIDGQKSSWNPTPNLLVDPELFAHDELDVHLKSTSPCIDAGVPGEKDPDGSVIDIGALAYDAGHVPPTATTHGVGCGGMTMTYEGEPWLGSVGAFTVGVEGAPPLAPLFLIVGLSNTSWNGVPLPITFPGWPNCQLRVEPLYVVTGLGAQADGSLTIPATLSDDPSVVGIPIHVQWAASEPHNSPFGLVFSDSLEFAHGN